MYLSAHPLDPYYMELTYGCNTSCEEFKDAEKVGAKVTFGGLVTNVQTRISRKGTEFSIIEIEDFTGKAELRLFGRNHTNFSSRFVVGDAVFVKLNYTAGRYDPERVDMNIEEISSLENIKGKVANAVTLFMDMRSKNVGCLDQILNCSDKSRPGQLFIDLIDGDTRQVVRIHSKMRVPINRETVNILEEYEMQFKITDQKE